MNGTDYLKRARSLKSGILEARQETESARRLAPSIEEALRDSGLCQLAIPSENGQDKVNPMDVLAVCEDLAGVEASVGWTVWNNSLPALFSRYLSDDVRSELFDDRRRLFANSTRPQGQIRPVAGGYQVSGRWSLVSHGAESLVRSVHVNTPAARRTACVPGVRERGDPPTIRPPGTRTPRQRANTEVQRYFLF